MRQRSDERAQQACECSQYRHAGSEKLSASPEKRPDHSSQDQHQQNLLPQRPLLPGHGHELADLVDGPGPDQLGKMKNCSNAFLQEFQQLIENLFHAQTPVQPLLIDPDVTWEPGAGSEKRSLHRQRALLISATLDGGRLAMARDHTDALVDPGNDVVSRARLQEGNAVLATGRQDAVTRPLHFRRKWLTRYRAIAERKT